MADETQKVLFVEWCAQDALGGMVQLAPMTELAYRRIIDMIYSTDDQLLDDDNVLQYSTKTGTKWKSIKKELIEVHKKIYVEDGRIRNAKCTEKLEKTWGKIEASSKAGKISAEKRKALKNNKAGSTDVEIPLAENGNESSTRSSTNHITNNQERKNTHGSATAARDPRPPDEAACDFSDFQDFFEAKPGRGGAPDPEDEARAEFERIIASADGPSGRALVDAMLRYRDQCRAQDPPTAGTRYAKSAARFLRDGVWRQYAGPEMPAAAPLPPIPDWLQPMLRLAPGLRLTEQQVRNGFGASRLEGRSLVVPSASAKGALERNHAQAIRAAFGNVEIVVEAPA